MKNKEVDVLNEISSFYANGDLMDELLVEREIQLIKKYSNNNNNSLEIGCGNGYLTERLIKIFNDLEILEPSINNVNLMKQKLKTSIKIHNQLIEDFEADKKYDNIIFLNVLEHVYNPIDCLKKLEELINDEGQIYISVPNCMSLNRRAGYKMGMLNSYDKLAEKDIILGHRRLYTVEMLKEHCELAGLKIIGMKGIYLKPLSEKQMLGLGMEAVKAFYSLGEDVPQYCANLFAVCTKKFY